MPRPKKYHCEMHRINLNIPAALVQLALADKEFSSVSELVSWLLSNHYRQEIDEAEKEVHREIYFDNSRG